VQVSGINNGTYTYNYQSTVSLLVIDFTLKERMVNLLSRSCRLWTPIVTGSHMFKRLYSWEELSLFSVKMNEAIDHGCNWNDGYVPYSELRTVLHREASSVAIYCFGRLKTEFISSFIDLKLVISLS